MQEVCKRLKFFIDNKNKNDNVNPQFGWARNWMIKTDYSRSVEEKLEYLISNLDHSAQALGRKVKK